MAGLSFSNNTIRQRSPNDDEDTPADAQDIDIGEAIIKASDKPVASVEYADGSVDIYINAGQKPPAKSLKDAKHGDNLADTLSSSNLQTLAEDLIRGIEEDKRSREEWMSARADGIKQLALSIGKDDKPTDGVTEGMGNTSRTRHTLLLEAVLRFQANARGELLPADGPVKVESKNDNDTIEGDDLAQQLEDDFNYYLTVTASEYYPDTDRMLFWVAAGGVGFKKVYRCPIRRRPVSESVDAGDLIVSNAATDLMNADRVTFVTKMRQSTMKRMQYLGVYREIDLGQPTNQPMTELDEARVELEGLRPSTRPEDVPYEIYECYCMIDVPGDEHKDGKEITGLPRPYKVTIDSTNHNILEIRRNWKLGDKMERPNEIFVKYPYVPISGFYESGLFQIAGSPTLAATALQRIMIDAGTYGNFPGFLVAKSSDKQNTTDIAVPPGGGAPIDTSMARDGDIRSVVMPLPYKEPGPAIFSLFENIVEQGKSVAGSADISVGEGKQDAPVGTTLALIEQATKIGDAVHKRLHTAQAKEFQLLRDLFVEYPEDFWKFNEERDPNWDKEKLTAALKNYNLVPVADPNTSSHMQRMMRAQALGQAASAHPEMYQVNAVNEYYVRSLGIRNPNAFIVQVPPMGSQPDPKVQAQNTIAQAKMQDSQTKAGELQLKAKTFEATQTSEAQDRETELASDKLKLQAEKAIHDSGNKAAVQTQALKSRDAQHAAQTGLISQVSAQRHERAIHAEDLQADTGKHVSGLMSDHAMQDQDHAHDAEMLAMQPKEDKGEKNE